MSSVNPAGRFSHRVFTGLALLLLAVCAVFTLYFLHVQKQRLDQALGDRGRGLTGLLATGAKIAVYSENAELVQETLQGVVDRRDVLAAAVFTLEPALVAAAGRSPALEAAAGRLTAWDITVAQRLKAQSGCVSRQDADLIDTICPVLIRERPVLGTELHAGTAEGAIHEQLVGFVKLTLDRTPLRHELAGLALRSLALMLVVLLFGAGAGFLFSRRVTRPLEQLTAAVRTFGTGGDVVSLPAMPDDEIGRLAEAFSGMTRDIAERERERERLAERLREAQKMEAVGALSQGISHDFKNILSTLKGAVHILQKGSPQNEFVLKYTSTMEVSLDRARDLVERLVAFSRTRKLEAAPVDLTALLVRQAPLLRMVLGEGARLQVEAPDAPVWVLGDAVSLEQMLSNLAYNARDAMPGGGTLRVRVESLAGASAREPGTARITVSDSGAGMDPGTLRRLFEPYFTTKDVGAGMGLGLSIVHGIVEQHRGRIEVESESGKGATFRVELPLLAGTEDERT